eukprot:NODE_572_length_1796_cov_73.931096_g563_i0.p1 GENE.NODE_572_length_1796_cov_73.931096_g563_i0~~NODE_572_length_1796_cov_73.931096_g563_i0.p1  ORF type:complete len:311 (-),score=50.25 NODE_572_length_1796_cov_73.931096_g563_i0:779-1711(-)
MGEMSFTQTLLTDKLSDLDTSLDELDQSVPDYHDVHQNLVLGRKGHIESSAIHGFQVATKLKAREVRATGDAVREHLAAFGLQCKLCACTPTSSRFELEHPDVQPFLVSCTLTGDYDSEEQKAKLQAADCVLTVTRRSVRLSTITTEKVLERSTGFRFVVTQEQSADGITQHVEHTPPLPFVIEDEIAAKERARVDAIAARRAQQTDSENEEEIHREQRRARCGLTTPPPPPRARRDAHAAMAELASVAGVIGGVRAWKDLLNGLVPEFGTHLERLLEVEEARAQEQDDRDDEERRIQALGEPIVPSVVV